MKKIILGIDCGSSGGIAIIGDGAVRTEDKLQESEIVDTLNTLCTVANMEDFELVAYIEEVGGFIGKAQPGSAMFKFGRSFGFWLGVLASCRIKTVLVKPQAWQKGLSGLQGVKGAERKRALKEHACRLFPDMKVTLANCDALLIADYGKRIER
jgi:hypothetical protein